MPALRLAIAFALLTLVACDARGPRAEAIAIATVHSPTGPEAFVRVGGLSGTELRALSALHPDARGWDDILTVSVLGADAPMAGRIDITDAAIEFHPAFPFEPGRAYTARFDPSRLPTPRREAPTTAPILLPAPARSPSSSVTALFPSGDVWPENLLRFYVQFSAPMSRGHGTQYIRILDDRGDEVPEAILAAFSDLWNQDTTRLTVFLDPGRVKRGIGPNVKMGRALLQGHRYAIAIDPAWPDANGQPLIAAFRRPFTAGAAAYRALDAGDWRVASPAAGTRGAVQVTFPTPLDRALLDRSVGVEDASGRAVTGTTTIDTGELGWRFTPQAPWSAGSYRVVILTLLEDPAGNKIGRAFEVLSDPTSAQSKEPDTLRIAFEVR